MDRTGRSAISKSRPDHVWSAVIVRLREPSDDRPVEKTLFVRNAMPPAPTEA